jgi:alkylation response protein AidB-like acyl-CoA dehydrogenase
MTQTAFSESPERQELRKAVYEFGKSFGPEYFLKAARAGERTPELWAAAAKNGYLGVNIPEEYGGGGGDLGDLAAVCEELAAAGAPLLLMVVSPAIVGTIITEFGTDEQKRRWLPGVADGTAKYVFAITEADAGSNSHKIVTTAYRTEDGGWRLTGNKTFISGVDEADFILVVARTEDAKTGNLKPALFMVPTDAEGLVKNEIDMGLVIPEKQFTLFFDDVLLPADSLVGEQDAAISQLFAGLIPERIMGASMSTGSARIALEKAVEYAKTRKVFKDTPIGAHQAIAHPLAEIHMELEMARLMTQKAAALLAAGDHMGAGEAANMAKYAAGKVAWKAVDHAIQTHGGNGLAREYGLVDMMTSVRLGRIAPVSEEMVLNFVAQFSLGLPKSY